MRSAESASPPRAQALIDVEGVHVVLVLAREHKLEAGEHLREAPLGVREVDNPLRPLGTERLHGRLEVLVALIERVDGDGAGLCQLRPRVRCAQLRAHPYVCAVVARAHGRTGHVARAVEHVCHHERRALHRCIRLGEKPHKEGGGIRLGHLGEQPPDHTRLIVAQPLEERAYLFGRDLNRPLTARLRLDPVRLIDRPRCG